MNSAPALGLELSGGLLEPVAPGIPWRAQAARPLPKFPPAPETDDIQIVLSFDVEEHYRIEAAAGLAIGSELKAHYARRLEVSTRWLLDQLGPRDIKATFFVVGQVARQNPALVRAIHRDGHEIASHSWDHRRVHHFRPDSFRNDVRRSKDVLEQIVGEEVVGFRAPTFSIVQQTSWAIDVLAESGMAYDSSIFPVHHDRYGMPRAPRVPFLAQGAQEVLLELPPATLRLFGTNLPVGGGGYFRLFPSFLLAMALRQLRQCKPAVATLYFHPWEFDPGQVRLPLARMNGFRTYVGIGSSRNKLNRLLEKSRFCCARDVAARLQRRRGCLPRWNVTV